VPIPLTPRRLPKRDDAAGRAYGELRDAMLAGVFRPGERIDLGAVAHWLDMSRTPVDHAITKLSADGLVTVEPYRGTFVSAGDAARFEATVQVLDIVHDAVLSALYARVSPEDRGLLLEAASAVADAGPDDAAAGHDRWLLAVGELAARIGNDVLTREEARLRMLVRHARVAAPAEAVTAHGRRWVERLRALGAEAGQASSTRPAEGDGATD
jgi:DNA-binding GntR family transcriptional regulator